MMQYDVVVVGGCHNGLTAAAYLALNPTGHTRAGWGVPMATDIAFAVGALALLGSRVRPALRVLLLALAIVDDIGAILVIALFYSSGVSVAGLFLAAGGVAAVFLLQRAGARSPWAYAPAGLVGEARCDQEHDPGHEDDHQGAEGRQHQNQDRRGFAREGHRFSLRSVGKSRSVLLKT